jgi:NAD(P)-dependent dehydrogenase (short-subunit alcohol dehydrogenase family)
MTVDDSGRWGGDAVGEEEDARAVVVVVEVHQHQHQHFLFSSHSPPQHANMSVAVIQGAGGSLGSHFARALLLRSNLNVVATSRDPAAARRTILEGGGKDGGKIDEGRLKVLEVDVREEETVRKAAETVRKEYGEKSLRFLLNASGVVRFSPFLLNLSFLEARLTRATGTQLNADKTVAEVDYDKLLESFQVRFSSFAH